MLDKERLGVEDKAVKRAPIKGPATVQCSKCGWSAMHLTSLDISPVCPECGSETVEAKKRD